MSDHFVDAAYQKKHMHDPMGGTPHIADEDDYRWSHRGRHVVLSDKLFEENYPTAVDRNAARTYPKSFYEGLGD